HKGVELTNEGRSLLPVLRQIINDEERLNQEVAEIQGLHKGILRIGTHISTSMHWLPLILEHFQTNYPEISIQIIECGQEEMITGLKEGTMDVILMAGPDEDDDVDFIPVYTDPMVVFYSNKHHSELNDYDMVPIEEIKEYPFLLTEANYDVDARKVFSNAGIVPNVKYTSKNDFAIMSMVERGIGISILPEFIIDGYAGEHSYKLVSPAYYRKLGIGVKSLNDAGPLVRLFIDLILENFGER
ncbi:MAG: LysR family transcriptional regulator, partial [Clostridiales bacterium]|nr:LysR family transcriptional regulator [Candidatus Crickella merdequi]